MILSAATILEHEFDHAVDAITDPDGHSVRSKTWDPIFGNKEEARAIKGSEAKTGQRNGEIKDGQHRKDHKAETRLRIIRTGDPTSTQEFSWEKWLSSFGNDFK